MLAILFENICEYFRENMKMSVFSHLFHKKDINSLGVNNNVKCEIKKVKFPRKIIIWYIFANISAILANKLNVPEYFTNSR